MNATAPLLFLVPCLAQDSNSASSLWSMISQGGWAMFPLALSSIILIYLCIHCYRETNPKRFSNATLVDRVLDFCDRDRLAEAIETVRQDPSLTGRLLAIALPRIQNDRSPGNTEKVDELIAESIDLEDHAIGQWIQYINVVAAVAPMIGLLGTVSGMIGAFQTMSSGGMGRPELLAGDIGEALITTATGLCIGIPAMIAHSYFNNRLNNQLVESAQQASQVTEALKELGPANPPPGSKTEADRTAGCSLSTE